MLGKMEMIQASGRTEKKAKEASKIRITQGLCAELRRQGLSCGELGANEGFPTGDEMIRTVSRENHSVVW